MKQKAVVPREEEYLNRGGQDDMVQELCTCTPYCKGGRSECNMRAYVANHSAMQSSEEGRSELGANTVYMGRLSLPQQG